MPFVFGGEIPQCKSIDELGCLSLRTCLPPSSSAAADLRVSERGSVRFLFLFSSLLKHTERSVFDAVSVIRWIAHAPLQSRVWSTVKRLIRRSDEFWCIRTPTNEDSADRFALGWHLWAHKVVQRIVINRTIVLLHWLIESDLRCRRLGRWSLRLILRCYRCPWNLMLDVGIYATEGVPFITWSPFLLFSFLL